MSQLQKYQNLPAILQILQINHKDMQIINTRLQKHINTIRQKLFRTSTQRQVLYYAVQQNLVGGLGTQRQ